MSFFDNIDYPHQLKKLTITELPQFCKELRGFIIDSVSQYGGHFGASLGVVELTVALHYVFNTPDDSLVWDVGHQAYGHKILTGRKKKFNTNRSYKGICGFPNRSESIYDSFGVGHSSTSISAALGMDIAAKQLNSNKHVVAIIGDGAMTAGLAFEAMNHASVTHTDILIILNDNNMSIDPNVGGLRNYLTSMSVSPTYNKVRNQIWEVMGMIPKINHRIRRAASNLEASFKGAMLASSNLFEALGLRYFGTTDGHDVIRLVHILRDLKKIKGPKLLHLITVKGKGFKLAEENQTLWHAPGTFDKLTGDISKIPVSATAPKPPKYQDVFGKTIIELAKENPKIVGVTPAMPTGSSLKWMLEQLPDRAFDVGICEQHAVTLSAGMASQGLKVFCNIYSTFMQRAYDQIIHDVAIQKLPVIFCLDRAGLVGEDGATHHGAYDIAYMRCIPNLIVSAPMNEIELRNMMFTAQMQSNKNPFVIRYPRGRGATIDWEKKFKKVAVGKARQIIKGKKVAILSIGHIGNTVADVLKDLATKKIKPSLYDMRFVKPLDKKLIKEVCQQYKYVITIEDGCLQGGFGSAILECIHNLPNITPPKIYRMGIPDKVVEHGKPSELYKECKFDSKTIQKKIEQFWKNKQ